VSDPGELSRFGLTVTGMVAGGKLGLHIEYDRSRFADESVARFQAGFRTTLQEIIRFCSNRNDSEMTPADLSYRNLSLHDLENIFD
jgi:non-ribosomal peptide synthase protein (TIGR01720 family)